MTVFISSHNISKLAKVQSTRSHVSRDNVVLLWDELNRKERAIAENIDIDVDVHTSDPSTVPDKWKDSITRLPGGVDHIDIVKNVIANPSRIDVYETLVEEDPPQPLMLWWLQHVFNDPEYAKTLADICHYSLFKTDTNHLWGAIAFGVEAGVGKFSWPDTSSDIPKAEQEAYNEALEKLDIREKELQVVWDDVKDVVGELLVDQTEVREEPEENVEDVSVTQSSLLDLP